MLESKSVVVGGGCVEAALSIYLENFATSLSSREQLAIADFAKSLLVIPKVKLKIIDFDLISWTSTLVRIQLTVKDKTCQSNVLFYFLRKLSHAPKGVDTVDSKEYLFYIF